LRCHRGKIAAETATSGVVGSGGGISRGSFVASIEAI
jgi:hypothetical protein